MRKNISVLFFIVIASVAAYFIGNQYFVERFYPNTSFAGIDISLLTQTEARDKIVESVSEYEFQFNESGREAQAFKLDNFGVEITPENLIALLMKEQDNKNWLQELFNKENTSIEIQNFVSLNEEDIRFAHDSINESTPSRTDSTNASIVYSEESGYTIETEQIGTQIDYSKLKELILESVKSGDQTIEVSSAYIQPNITSSDDELISTLEQIDAVTSMEITLTIAGYEEVITSQQISSWIIIDDNQDVNFDQDLIYEYLGELNAEYATYDDYRYFESTLQGQVQLLPGTLGWSIDREAETQNIVDDLSIGKSIERQPAIVGSGYNGTSDDITSSYIEVDITNQTMFVYLEGEVVISTPIVSGQIGTNTIPGTYVIWNMETPSQLTGYNPRTESEYIQPVQYWIAFDDTGQGVHDASWQAAFGGNIYQANGSLGCINTPPDIMPLVFEYAYPGMPVLVFE